MIQLRLVKIEKVATHLKKNHKAIKNVIIVKNQGILGEIILYLTNISINPFNTKMKAKQKNKIKNKTIIEILTSFIFS